MVRCRVYQRSQLRKFPASYLNPEHEMRLTHSQTLIDFRVMQWNANGLGSWGSGEIVNYRVDIGAGHTLTSEWKVPNVENGCVRQSPAITIAGM